VFRVHDAVVLDVGAQLRRVLRRVLRRSGRVMTAGRAYTGGLQGTADTRSLLYRSMVSRILVPFGICVTIPQLGLLDSIHSRVAIVIGHATRCG
jgi:hypothetical protein